MTRKRIITIVSIIILLAFAFMLMNVFEGMKEEPEQQEVPEAKRYVKANAVNYTDVSISVTATGRVISQHIVKLSSQVQGEILEGDVPLKKGQTFHKGDVLVRIFDKDTEYNLKAAKSSFLTSIAAILPDIKIDFSNRYDAWQQFFAEIELDKGLPELPAINNVKEKTFLASKGILSTFYTIKSQEIYLAKFIIYAPFTGSYTDVFMEVGSIANPGAVIASMIKSQKLEIEVPVKQEEAGWIKNGDDVKVYNYERSQSWEGKVKRISDYVDEGTQSISVFIELENSNKNRILRGQYLYAVFGAKNIGSSMEIPRNAVFDKNHVYVVIDGKLQKRQIQIEKINEESLVFTGLKEGIDLVVEPLVNVSENTQVEIIR